MKLTNILLVCFKQHNGTPYVWRSLSHIKALNPSVVDYRIIAEYVGEETGKVIVASNLNNHRLTGSSYRCEGFHGGNTASFEEIERDFRNPKNNWDIISKSLMMSISFAMYVLRRDSVFS